MYNKIINKNLVVLEDLISSSFYISLTRGYRRFLIDKALKKKRNFKELAKEIECSAYTLRHFRDYKEKSINAPILKRILAYLKIPIRDVEKYVLSVKRGCSNRAVEIKLPLKPCPELALILAKVYGDGSILSDWRFHYCNNQLNLMQEVIDNVNFAFGKSKYILHNRLERKTFEIKFSPVVGYILHLVGGPKSYKINQDFELPEWIVNADTSVKSSFLRGIFDDESTVDFRGTTTKRIILVISKKQIYSKSLITFFGQIKKLLFELNINTSKIRIQEIYGDKIALGFGIYGKTNFENFKKFIDFTHSKKKKILTNILDSYVDKHKTRKSILEILKKMKFPLTILEIAELNNLNTKVVGFHLYNMLREGLVYRIRDYPTYWYAN